MKTSLKYKFLLVLLGLFQLPSNILWAQNPELANHNWYFHHGEVNEEAFFLPNSDLPTSIHFDQDNFYVDDYNCNHGWFFGNLNFNQDGTTFTLPIEPGFLNGWDICPDYQWEFIGLHNQVYFTTNEETENPLTKNPFTYILTSVNDYFQLKIENVEGDWAVYNSVLLSEPSFETQKFNLYPNPVANILNIQGSNDVLQNARLELYDVTGKSLAFETIATDANFVSINVSHLNSGIYFLKINHKDASQETLRFVKP